MELPATSTTIVFGLALYASRIKICWSFGNSIELLSCPSRSIDWLIPITAITTSDSRITFEASPYMFSISYSSMLGTRQWSLAIASPPLSKYSAFNWYFFPFSNFIEAFSVRALCTFQSFMISWSSIYNLQPSSLVKLNTYSPDTLGTSSPVQRIESGDLGRNGSGAWFFGSKLIPLSMRVLGVPWNVGLS